MINKIPHVYIKSFDIASLNQPIQILKSTQKFKGNLIILGRGRKYIEKEEYTDVYTDTLKL